MTRAARIALALYAVFIVGLVVTADLYGTERMFGLIVYAVPYGDKIGHFFLIGVLALLADLSFARRNVLRVPLAPAVVLAIAVLEEISQHWLPTRSFELLDLCADFSGVAIFVGIERLATWTSSRRTDAPRSS